LWRKLPSPDVRCPLSSSFCQGHRLFYKSTPCMFAKSNIHFLNRWHWERNRAHILG
jgi:hypothetical protein